LNKISKLRIAVLREIDFLFNKLCWRIQLSCLCGV